MWQVDFSEITSDFSDISDDFIQVWADFHNTLHGVTFPVTAITNEIGNKS
jgi:hypothetical protein